MYRIRMSSSASRLCSRFVPNFHTGRGVVRHLSSGSANTIPNSYISDSIRSQNFQTYSNVPARTLVDTVISIPGRGDQTYSLSDDTIDSLVEHYLSLPPRAQKFYAESNSTTDLYQLAAFAREELPRRMSRRIHLLDSIIDLAKLRIPSVSVGELQEARSILRRFVAELVLEDVLSSTPDACVMTNSHRNNSSLKDFNGATQNSLHSICSDPQSSSILNNQTNNRKASMSTTDAQTSLSSLSSSATCQESSSTQMCHQCRTLASTSQNSYISPNSGSKFHSYNYQQNHDQNSVSSSNFNAINSNTVVEDSKSDQCLLSLAMLLERQQAVPFNTLPLFLEGLRSLVLHQVISIEESDDYFSLYANNRIASNFVADDFVSRVKLRSPLVDHIPFLFPMSHQTKDLKSNFTHHLSNLHQEKNSNFITSITPSQEIKTNQKSNPNVVYKVADDADDDDAAAVAIEPFLKVINRAVADAKLLFEQTIGPSPNVFVSTSIVRQQQQNNFDNTDLVRKEQDNGESLSGLVLVPSYLYYIAFETIKNALKASLPTNSVKVVISLHLDSTSLSNSKTSGVRLGVKIEDQGTGVQLPRGILSATSIFSSYSNEVIQQFNSALNSRFSDVETSQDDNDDDDSAADCFKNLGAPLHSSKVASSAIPKSLDLPVNKNSNAQLRFFDSSSASLVQQLLSLQRSSLSLHSNSKLSTDNQLPNINKSLNVMAKLSGFQVGLPLTKSYVNFLGGTLSLKSQSGLGTTVDIEIPIGSDMRERLFMDTSVPFAI